MNEGRPCGNEHAAVAEEDVPSDLLRMLIEPRATQASHMSSPAGLIIGTLVGMADSGTSPLVSYPGQPGSAALRARTIVELLDRHVGGSVALVFEANDPAKPIVLGMLREAGTLPLRHRGEQLRVEADGERLVVHAGEEIVLRCGEASITLTRAGKVLIRGTYILSRSKGINRITGGSVQIN